MTDNTVPRINALIREIEGDEAKVHAKTREVFEKFPDGVPQEVALELLRHIEGFAKHKSDAYQTLNAVLEVHYRPPIQNVAKRRWWNRNDKKED